MSETNGVIQKKDVKAFQWGNRISLMIGNKWYSVFDNKIKSAEAKALIEQLKEGDEVDLTFTEEPNKTGDKVFLTIQGIEKVERIDGENKPAPKRDKAGMDHAEEVRMKNRAVGLSYVKDQWVAGVLDRDCDWRAIANEYVHFIETGE